MKERKRQITDCYYYSKKWLLPFLLRDGQLPVTPAEPELHQNNSKISVSLTKASKQKFQGCRFSLDIRKGLLLEILKRKTCFLWGSAVPGTGFDHSPLPRPGTRDSAVHWMTGVFLALRPRNSTIGNETSPCPFEALFVHLEARCSLPHS